MKIHYFYKRDYRQGFYDLTNANEVYLDDDKTVVIIAN